MRIMIATIKSWNIDLANKMKLNSKYEILIISSPEQFTFEVVREYAPDYIFFPHWSYIIPAEIYENYNCVVFHMTDLPYGRGGSPLQNLILRGHTETKISAIKVTKEIDAGAIYMKVKLSLVGSAQEIFVRASNIIFSEMIPAIIEKDIVPKEQVGVPTLFKRRGPKESEMNSNLALSEMYDYIRMLDAEGYPKAFIRYGTKRLEFTKARNCEGQITAQVVIREDKDE